MDISPFNFFLSLALAFLLYVALPVTLLVYLGRAIARRCTKKR